MRIVCPSCAATYEFADEMLARPRTVRCSRCAQEWVQDPIPAAPVEIAEAATDPVPETPAAPDTLPPGAPDPSQDDPTAHAPMPALFRSSASEPELPEATAGLSSPPRAVGRAVLRLAWIASLLLLAVLAFAAYRYRGEIQLAWPPSARLFQLLPG